MTITVAPEAGTRHAEVISGLENLAAFLATHPELPLVSGDNPFDVHVFAGTDEENRAEVDRIGRILGVTPSANGSHYTAVRNFGGVVYKATAISRASMDRYRRHMAPYYTAEAQAEAAAA